MYSGIIIDSIIELINNGRGGQELLFKKLTISVASTWTEELKKLTKAAHEKHDIQPYSYFADLILHQTIVQDNGIIKYGIT